MKLKYPSLDKRPIVLMVVQSGGHFDYMPMILDTGSDTTCFPAHRAVRFGHSNLAPGVLQRLRTGIGGGAIGYLHSGLNISLIDPFSRGQYPESEFPDVAWTSAITEFHFLEGFDADFGILGRDIMHEWKSFKMIPDNDEWIMEIEI